MQNVVAVIDIKKQKSFVKKLNELTTVLTLPTSFTVIIGV